MKQPKSFLIGIILIIVLVLALLLTGCTAADTDASTSYMLGFLLLFIGLPILLVILLIVWLLTRKPKGQSPEQNKDDKYLTIAKERYAKGEITQEQYEQIKKEFS